MDEKEKYEQLCRAVQEIIAAIWSKRGGAKKHRPKLLAASPEVRKELADMVRRAAGRKTK